MQTKNVKQKQDTKTGKQGQGNRDTKTKRE